MASPAQVQHVMQSCNCSKREAIDLLRHSGNDPQQAQQRHQMKLNFGWLPPSRSSVQHSTPVDGKPAYSSTSRPHATGSTPDQDDYDIITPQSDQEVFTEPTNPTKTGNPKPQLHSIPFRSSLFGSVVNDRLLDSNGRTVTQNPDESRDPMTFPPPRDVQQGTRPNDPLEVVNEPSNETSVINDRPTQPSEEQHISCNEEDEAAGSSKGVNQESAGPNERHVERTSSARPEWDFVLPRVSSAMPTGTGRGVHRFNIREAVALLQTKADEQVVMNYFENFETHIIQSYINQEVDGFPSIFYAVATNNERILRAWIDRGADVNAVHEDSGVPLLAFAIIHSETIEEDTSEIVATLLSTGASPLAIAEPFYKPYDQDLDDDGPSDEDFKLCGSKQTVWLHPTSKRKLVRNLNLTHRYYLERASRTPNPSVRQKQVADRNKAQGLLGLPYFLIGQSLAANRLLQTCVNHLANHTDRRKPLVIVFAGPSGHGKTELARRLGYLMSLDLEVVDCTIVNREMELFGGRHPYVNAGEGTPINNFLAQHSGQRCIVFMDEFEKTTKEIHQALLLPFDNGEYQDRRNLKKVDCSKTIWILATNALDKRIRNFCKVNEAVLFKEEENENRTRLMKELDKDLKNDFLAKFDAPITGRISAFLPFLLFSTAEQSVIAHKYLLELGREVRKPVNLAVGPEERLIGNVRLHIRRDASVCAHIAQDGYHPDLGARSLITTVDNVRNMLVDAYLEVDEAIREAEELVDFTIDIRKGNVIVEVCS